SWGLWRDHRVFVPYATIPNKSSSLMQGFGKARIIPNVRREKNPTPSNRFFWNAPNDFKYALSNQTTGR
ncbi:MAG: hypothetical protein ACP5XB_25210, partial [Isosphaeraceae bacterium]